MYDAMRVGRRPDDTRSTRGAATRAHVGSEQRVIRELDRVDERLAPAFGADGHPDPRRLSRGALRWRADWRKPIASLRIGANPAAEVAMLAGIVAPAGIHAASIRLEG